MIQQTLAADKFKEQLRRSLERETQNSRPIQIPRHTNVYTCGDMADNVYFIAARSDTTNTDRFFVIKETKLTDYLAQIAEGGLPVSRPAR